MPDRKHRTGLHALLTTSLQIHASHDINLTTGFCMKCGQSEHHIFKHQIVRCFGSDKIVAMSHLRQVQMRQERLRKKYGNMLERPKDPA